MTCVTMYMCKMKVAETGVSAVTPCRTVWIQRLHPWEWYGFVGVPPVCHPCVTLCHLCHPADSGGRKGGTFFFKLKLLQHKKKIG